MSERLSNKEFLGILKETFKRGQELRFTPTGRSMLPMLDGVNDTFTFAPVNGRLKKYDVPFYQRDNGQLVLHRVVGFDKDGGYVMSGDGQYYFEHGITDDNILAIMVSFTHKGKTHSVTDLSYRLYIRRMMFMKLLKMFARKVYHKLKRK